MAFVFPEDKADFLAPNGVMYSWDGDKWRTKSFKADVEGDSGLMASVQRVEDNLDLLQDTVSTGEYIRAAKPGDPTGPKEGEGQRFCRTAALRPRPLLRSRTSC